jgi:hypothetical protein
MLTCSFGGILMKRLLALGIILSIGIFVGCSLKSVNNTVNNTPLTVKTADLYGEVSNINGNEITIKIIQTPKMNASSKNLQPSDGQKEGQNGSQSSGQAAYTGETKTITVTSEVSITTFDRSSQEKGEKKITLNDIKVGDRLDVYYASSDENKVSVINLMASVGE